MKCQQHPVPPTSPRRYPREGEKDLSAIIPCREYASPDASCTVRAWVSRGTSDAPTPEEETVARRRSWPPRDHGKIVEPTFSYLIHPRWTRVRHQLLCSERKAYTCAQHELAGVGVPIHRRHNMVNIHIGAGIPAQVHWGISWLFELPLYRDLFSFQPTNK